MKTCSSNPSTQFENKQKTMKFNADQSGFFIDRKKNPFVFLDSQEPCTVS